MSSKVCVQGGLTVPCWFDSGFCLVSANGVFQGNGREEQKEALGIDESKITGLC